MNEGKFEQTTLNGAELISSMGEVATLPLKELDEYARKKYGYAVSLGDIYGYTKIIGDRVFDTINDSLKIQKIKEIFRIYHLIMTGGSKTFEATNRQIELRNELDQILGL